MPWSSAARALASSARLGDGFANMYSYELYSLNSLKGGYRAIQGLGFRI